MNSELHIQNLENILAKPPTSPRLTRQEHHSENEIVIQQVTHHFSRDTRTYWDSLISLNNTTKAHSCHCNLIQTWNAFNQEAQEQILADLKRAVGLVPDAHSDLWFLLCFGIIRGVKDKNVTLITRVISRLKERPLRPYGIITDRNMLIVLLNNRMLAHKAFGDFQSAIHDFSSIIDVDNQYAIAYSNASGVYLAMQNFEMAMKCCNKAIEIDRGFHVPYYMRGLVHRLTNNLQNALNDFTTAIQSTDEYKLAYHERSKVHLSLNNIQEAVMDAAMVIKLDPNHIEAYYVRGYGLSRNKDWERAYRDLIHAVNSTQNPSLLKSIHAVLGEVYFNRREFTKSIEQYNAALKYDNNDAEVYVNRSYSHEMLNDMANAFKDAEKALSLHPNNQCIKDRHTELKRKATHSHSHQQQSIPSQNRQPTTAHSTQRQPSQTQYRQPPAHHHTSSTATQQRPASRTSSTSTTTGTRPTSSHSSTTTRPQATQPRTTSQSQTRQTSQSQVKTSKPNPYRGL